MLPWSTWLAHQVLFWDGICCLCLSNKNKAFRRIPWTAIPRLARVIWQVCSKCWYPFPLASEVTISEHQLYHTGLDLPLTCCYTYIILGLYQRCHSLHCFRNILCEDKEFCLVSVTKPSVTSYQLWLTFITIFICDNCAQTVLKHRNPLLSPSYHNLHSHK